MDGRVAKKNRKAELQKPGTKSIRTSEIDIDAVADRVMRRLWERLKYFIYGFVGLVLVVTGMEVFSKAELLEMLHNRLFPGNDMVAISYEATIELRESERGSNSGHMSFYATECQMVKMYAYFNHRFDSDGEPWRIVVAVDNHEVFDEPTEQIYTGFTDITELVHVGHSSPREKVIHHLSFSLSDGQPIDTMEVVTVECVVVVYGNTN